MKLDTSLTADRATANPTTIRPNKRTENVVAVASTIAPTTNSSELHTIVFCLPKASIIQPPKEVGGEVIDIHAPSLFPHATGQ